MPATGGAIASEIRDITAADELGQSFLPYSLSVITARALPDVRDGLKPVQRRILVAMNEMGLRPGAPHRKSANVVGETMGNYHPHGDGAIYEALVRMGQPFSLQRPARRPPRQLRLARRPARRATATPSAAWPRPPSSCSASSTRTRSSSAPPTTARAAEPVCLPARLPNLLVNGSSGIAVGMATNMPPHNLRRGLPGARARAGAKRPPTTARAAGRAARPRLPHRRHRHRRRLPGAPPTRPAGARSGCGPGPRSARSRARRQGIVVTELPYIVGPERVIGRISELVGAGKLGARRRREGPDRPPAGPAPPDRVPAAAPTPAPCSPSSTA